jgi:hypothetical protein
MIGLDGAGKMRMLEGEEEGDGGRRGGEQGLAPGSRGALSLSQKESLGDGELEVE